MAKFNEYPAKTVPEDADTLMIYDAATKSNKLSPFSGIWNWIVGKLTNAVISNLHTNNKTVLGAINELNSKTPFLINGGIDTTTDLNTLTTSGLQPKIYGKNCPNSPGFGCFVLNIKASGNGANGLTQIAIGYLTNNIYVRNSDLVGWTPWSKIYSNT